MARHESVHGNDKAHQGVVFIDRGVTLGKDIALTNSLINEGAVVNTSVDNAMIFSEDL